MVRNNVGYHLQCWKGYRLLADYWSLDNVVADHVQSGTETLQAKVIGLVGSALPISVLNLLNVNDRDYSEDMGNFELARHVVQDVQNTNHKNGVGDEKCTLHSALPLTEQSAITENTIGVSKRHTTVDLEFIKILRVLRSSLSLAYAENLQQFTIDAFVKH